jgi:hypothetical protein
MSTFVVHSIPRCVSAISDAIRAKCGISDEDAYGSDESGWQRDRRVDVMLGD